jgi:thioredoxin reductase
VAVVGAGPHGLATAAFLSRAGVAVHTFGETMGFWRRHMPRGMLLRGRRRSSHLPDPERRLSIEAFEASTGRRLTEPIRVEDFIAYGDWYQRRTVPEVDPRRVVRLDRSNGGFSLSVAGGESVQVARVVVATGLEGFGRRPPPFTDLPRQLASHSADHLDLERLGGGSVAVIGGGQSALESAALLAEAGARVEVLSRALTVRWLREYRPRSLRANVRRVVIPPTDLGGWGSGWAAAAPDLLRRMPEGGQAEVYKRVMVPAGAAWLRPRLAEVPISVGRSVVAATRLDGGVRLALDDGSERHVDHVLLGTGYEVDLSAYRFISPEVLSEVELVDGYPALGEGYESSVPGLHFVGAPAARSYGPLMNFIVGSWHAAPAVTRRILGRRQPAVRLSYRPRVALHTAAVR